MGNFLSQEQVYPNYIASIKKQSIAEGIAEGRAEGRVEEAVKWLSEILSHDEAKQKFMAEFETTEQETEEIFKKYSKQ